MVQKLRLTPINILLCGKTGKWLAEQLGKSNCTVSKWCSNSIQPDLQTIDKIATILNIDRRTLIEPSDNGKK